jgi:hypothetical protein
MIFMRVRLNAADKTAPLQVAGINIQQKEILPSKEIRKSFRLPCEAFRNNCCQVYIDRPGSCRKFKCELLKKFERGAVSWEDAREKIVSVQRLREILQEEILKTSPEYNNVSIPALAKLLPTHEELRTDAALSKKWGNLLMYLSALREQIASDFYPPPQNSDSARGEAETGEL